MKNYQYKLAALVCMLSLIFSISASEKDQGKTAGDWIAVAGKHDYYKNIKGKEVVLKGTYIAEYYGEPGHTYTVAPYNYYLKTKEGTVGMIYLEDFDLDNKEIEAKGKLVVKNGKITHMYVGWYRLIKKTAEK